MRKKLFIILGCLFLLLLGIGLADLVNIFQSDRPAVLTPGVFYKSKNVTVTGLEPAEHPMTRYTDVPPYDEHDYFSDITVVVTGTVTKVQEAEAQYQVDGRPYTSKMTLFDLAVEEYLYTESDALNGKETLRLGVFFTSYSSNYRRVMIEEGESFLICCRLASELEGDVAHRKEYMDCWILTPGFFLIEGAGSKYIMIECFKQYLTPEDLIMNVLQVNEEQVKAYCKANTEEALNELALQDPNGLLAVLKERVIGWDTSYHNYPNDVSKGVWSFAQEYYAVDKKIVEDLIVDIVKRNK